MPTPALYVADFWIYLESGALDGKFRFVYPGTTAVPSAYGDWLEPTCDLSSVKQGEWVKVTTGVPGDIAQEIKSVIRFMYTPSSDVVFYVDDFSVRSVDEVPPTVNPELDNYFGFERSNMPGNGSEKHQAGWWIQHNGAYQVTDEIAHSGSYSLLYSSNQALAEGQRRFVATIPADPTSHIVSSEGQHQASMWVYKKSEEMGHLAIQIQKKDGHEFAQADFDFSVVPQNTWTEVVSKPFQLNHEPSTQALNKPTIQISYPLGAPASTFYLDDIKVMSATATSIESAEAKSSKVFTYGNEVSIIGAADKTVKVYTTSGALIYTKTINSNNEKLNLSQSGIYLIDIEGEKVQKVVLNLKLQYSL